MKKILIALAVLAVCFALTGTANAQFKDDKIDANAAIKGSKIEYPTFSTVTDGSAPTAAAYLTYTKRSLKVGDIIRKTNTAEYFKCTSTTGPAWKPLAGGNSDGTASLPAYSFASDVNTGMYSKAADNIGFSAGGTLRLDLSTTYLTSTVPIVHPLGSSAAPSVTFVSDTDTGLSAATANTLILSAGGAANTLTLDSSGVAYTHQILAPTGAATAGNVSYSFSGDTNTGIFSTGADGIGFSTGGTQRLSVASSAVTAAVPLAMGTNKITGLGTPTDGTDATTKTYVDSAFAYGSKLSSTSVDVGAVAVTPLYTVGAGKTCNIKGISIRGASGTFNQATDPIFDIGWQAVASNVVNSATYTTPTAATTSIELTIIAEKTVGAAAEVLNFNVTQAATASTTATVDVFGYCY